MELLLNGEASAQRPDADLLVRWFGAEHDPADFLILRDRARGELRATAPQHGSCLLQAEGAVAPDARFTEFELSPADAARLFVQFLSGDPAFKAVLDRRPDPSSLSWLGWLVGVLLAAAAWWAWNAL